MNKLSPGGIWFLAADLADELCRWAVALHKLLLFNIIRAFATDLP
eukprot:CAMPEP_0172703704 /NCGR_PEP_ID=MMETSP1074-20121228/38504_1 /TAXON_ID=2916 /ORGANISM="Ceratium fusus, Strain PA161109" /LENGTH=44 /DNA_ID= /DNA_START= /DNA_END= /DNA_ORIENTATION=